MIKYDKMEISVCVQVDVLHPMWGVGGGGAGTENLVTHGNVLDIILGSGPNVSLPNSVFMRT